MGGEVSNKILLDLILFHSIPFDNIKYPSIYKEYKHKQQ